MHGSKRLIGRVSGDPLNVKDIAQWQFEVIASDKNAAASKMQNMATRSGCGWDHALLAPPKA